VLAVDLDPLSELGRAMGVMPREERSVGTALVEQLAGGRPETQRMTHCRIGLLAGRACGGGLEVFAGTPGSAREAERVIAIRDYPGTLALRSMLEEAGARYDVVVIDTPPMISALSATGLAAADAVAVVSELSSAALPGAAVLKAGVEATRDRTGGRGCPRFLGTLLNKVPAGKAGAEDEASEQLFRQAGLRAFRTRIPWDAMASQALDAGIPVSASCPDGPLGLAYREVVEEIVSRALLTDI
jgi:chromosome partitioning protein